MVINVLNGMLVCIVMSISITVHRCIQLVETQIYLIISKSAIVNVCFNYEKGMCS